MVFHFGISPEKKKVAVYDTITKETNVSKIDIRMSDKEDICEFYDALKDNFPNDLGYACIYLAGSYGNEIRKDFIEKGKECGFLDVYIIGTVLYLSHVFQAEYKPKNGDIIWVYVSLDCYFFQKREDKAEAIGSFFMDGSPSQKDIMTIKNGTPNLIVYNGFHKSNEKFFKKIFPESKVFITEKEWKCAEACSIIARIIANDPEVMEYNFDFAYFDENIYVKVNDAKFIEFKAGRLPMEKSEFITFEKNTECKLFVHAGFYETFIFKSLFYEEIDLTPEMLKIGEILLIITIDENGIGSINYEIPEIVSSFERRLVKFYEEDSKEKPIFDIPQKLSNKNINFDVIGIDLGTSRCCSAVNRTNGIEIIALDNTGQRQLPSYVAFDEENPKCGMEVVRRLQNYAKSTVFDSKRIIGKAYEKLNADESWPFEVINVDDKPMIQIQGPDNSILLKHPEEVSAILLEHIKKKAEEFQDKNLDEVVITIPSAFGEKQKFATHVAASVAQWKKIHFLAEPIAASIAYFIDRPIPPEFTLLLFDLGGGTLDICIFKIAKGKLKVVVDDGDASLGGRDFDQLLFNHFATILEKDYQIDVKIKDRFKYRLLQKCMEIKHALSTDIESGLDLDDFNREGYLKITRVDFEKLAIPLLGRIQEVLIQTLSKTNYTALDINKVLLVGGGCRMPMIQQFLRKMFTKAEHSCDENPDEVVAIGAAYYASFLNSQNNSRCSIM